MRIVLFFLGFLMLLLLANTGAYLMSEEYRFFLKKIKYQEEIVQTENTVLSDRLDISENISLEDSEDTSETESNRVEDIEENTEILSFFDIEEVSSGEETGLPEMSATQIRVQEAF